MEIREFNLNSYDQNTYVYYNPATKKGVLIDAGLSGESVLEFLEREKIEIEGILLTHGHFDHIYSLADIKTKLGKDVYIGKHEKKLLETPSLNLSPALGEGKEIYGRADVFVEHEQEINLGEFSFKVLHTPGHTSGCVSYYDETNGNLFSGDLLFSGSVGRTDLPTSNHHQLIDSIKTRVFLLPKETKVYAGHGKPTSIEKEMKTNPFI